MRRSLSVLLVFILAGCWSVLAQSETDAVRKGRESFAKDLRISAIMSGESGLRVGIVDGASQNSYVLKPGQKFLSDIEIVSIDYDMEKVLLKKDDKYCELYLTGDPSARVRWVDATTGRTAGEALAQGTTGGVRQVILKTPSGNVELVPSEKNSKYTMIKRDGKAYAIDGVAAQSVIDSETLTEDQKLNALMTYPALVEVNQGDDPTEKAQQAENATMPAVPPEFPSLLPQGKNVGK